MGKRGPKPVPIEQRFWRFVSRGTPGQCWEWRGNKLPKGYGILRAGGKNVYAHRLSFEMHVGEIPSGMVVMHSCDNPKCVNPAHLSAGTYTDNSVDCVRKGRHRRLGLRGEDHPLNIFSEITVQRLKIVSGAIGYWKLAKMIGKPISATQGVLNGKNWQHLGTKQALMV